MPSSLTVRCGRSVISSSSERHGKVSCTAAIIAPVAPVAPSLVLSSLSSSVGRAKQRNMDRTKMKFLIFGNTVHVCMCLCVCVYVCACVCMCVGVCVCVCVCVPQDFALLNLDDIVADQSNIMGFFSPNSLCMWLYR